MFVSTAALLLASALQAPATAPAQDAPPPPLPPPFELALPKGYETFLQVDPTLERWVSRRGDDLGAFTVEHFQVTAPGANPEATAAQIGDGDTDLNLITKHDLADATGIYFQLRTGR